MDLNLFMFRMGVMIVINTKTENGFLRRILTLELKIQHPKKTTQKKRKDSLENKMLHLKFSDKIEVGCDEAGRGCLAGPVIAAAVLLPDNFSNQITLIEWPDILDVKSLSRYVSINILETKKLKEHRDVEVAFFGNGWDDLIVALLGSRHFNNENI